MPLQPLHMPEDLAAMLGRSKWWVCEQCRRGRFPFVKAGGSYRFTDEHVAEILIILEQTPTSPSHEGKAGSGKPRRASPPKPSESSKVTQLRARPPRRRPTGGPAKAPNDDSAEGGGRSSGKPAL